MAEINVQPFVLRDVTLMVVADDYKQHVSSVTFTPTAETVAWTGLANNVFQDIGRATWTCTLEFAQDWTTPDSLASYLLANEGNSVEMEFAPQSGSAMPNFTATVTITPGAIGGAVNTVAVATVVLPVSGTPTPGTTPV